MKPVDQTTFGIPGGNCFSACVASLLEIPVESVPYFMGSMGGEDTAAWYSRFAAWLRPRGFYPLCFAAGADRPLGLHILGGVSPRGLHAVVAELDRVVHDPHPSRAGLISVEEVIVLVPFNPAEVRR